MAGITATLYNAIFKRTSTFALACITGALIFERGLEVGTTYVFESINRGKLYNHLREKFDQEG